MTVLPYFSVGFLVIWWVTCIALPLFFFAFLVSNLVVWLVRWGVVNIGGVVLGLVLLHACLLCPASLLLCCMLLPLV